MNLLLHPDQDVYQGFLKNLGTAACLISVDDDDGYTLIAVNDGVHDFFSFPITEVPLRLDVPNLARITGSAIADLKAYVALLHRHYGEVVATATQKITEMRYDLKDDQPQWYRSQLAPVVDDGKVVRLITTFVDVTEIFQAQRKREQSLDALIAQLTGYCKACNKVQAQDGTWLTMTEYIETNSPQKFTHGICPNCVGDL